MYDSGILAYRLFRAVGEIVVKESKAAIESIELQLVRVETVAYVVSFA